MLTLQKIKQHVHKYKYLWLIQVLLMIPTLQKFKQHKQIPVTVTLLVAVRVTEGQLTTGISGANDLATPVARILNCCL